MKRHFVLSFEDEAQRQFTYDIIKTKNYNVIIDGQNVFDQPLRHKLITYDSTGKMQQVKKMIMQLDVCWTIIISKTIIR